MKWIELTKGYKTCVDDEDYAELSKHKWCALVTDPKTIYAVRNSSRTTGKTTLYMHRVIKGTKDRKLKVDHIDNNGLNNLRSNLRECTHAQNIQNQRIRKGLGCSSQYKGVSWSKLHSKWEAHIAVNGKQRFLGLFTDELKACIAYNEAAIQFHREFARLNILEESCQQ